jgi:hypothetical protein
LLVCLNFNNIVQNLWKTFGKLSIYRKLSKNLINNNHNNYNEMSNLKQTFKNLFSLGEVNPVQDEKLIFKILLACERASIIVVAVVSGVAVAAYGYLLASGYTEWEVVRWATAALLFVLATAITDVGVKYFIQKGAFDFFMFFKFEWWEGLRQSAFVRAMQLVAWVCMCGLIAGMFLFDYYSVDAVRDPVANMVKQEKTVNADSLRQIVDAQEQARVGAVVSAIDAVKADIRATEIAIEQERRKIASGYDKGIELYEKKNAWFFQKKLNPAFSKSSSIKGLNAQLATLRQNKADLEQQRTRDLTYRSKVIATTDSTALATNTAITARNNDLVTGTSTMFIWLGFFAKCIAGLIRVMLVVLFLGNPVDANQDGKVDYRDVTSAAAGGFLAG